MYFDGLDAALTMDGHGLYVWSAYAITFLVLAQVLHWPRRSRRRFLRELRAEQRRNERRESGLTQAGLS